MAATTSDIQRRFQSARPQRTDWAELTTGRVEDASPTPYEFVDAAIGLDGAAFDATIEGVASAGDKSAHYKKKKKWEWGPLTRVCAQRTNCLDSCMVLVICFHRDCRQEAHPWLIL